MHTPRTLGNRRRAWMLALAVVVLPVLAGGCSSVPDAANPAHWYRSTANWISGDDKAKAAENTADAKDKKKATEPSTAATEKDAPPPGADKPYPSLSSVPERPKRTVPEGLGADPNRPKYAAAVPRQEDFESSTRGAPSLAKTQAATQPPTQPPPPAMPTMPVEKAPQSAPATMARAAPPVMAPPEPPAPPAPAGTSVESTYRAKMAETKVPSQAQSQVSVVAPASDDLDTVVVSSQGVESGGGQVTAAMNAPTGAPITAYHGVDGARADNAGVNARSVKVATVLFANGSSTVGPRGRQVLEQVVKLYKEKGGVVRIVGHASSRTRTMDPVQHKMVNFKVSVSRADAVARVLLQQGVAKDRIVVGAVSDADPQYFEVMPTGEAGNRRAEVYIDF